ncbi:MAG: zf-HC2 domain-containing protein [Pseudomonadota bacterium]
MNCRQAGKKLSAYLDRELDRTGTAALAAHVRDCPGCRAELSRLRQVDDWLRDQPWAEPPLVPIRPPFLRTAGRRVSRRKTLARAVALALEEMLSLFGAEGGYRTNSLEAFRDAPPFFISQIYLPLLGARHIKEA